MFSSALWLYEFKFQMVSEYSTLVQFQSGTREKIRALHYNNLLYFIEWNVKNCFVKIIKTHKYYSYFFKPKWKYLVEGELPFKAFVE